MSCSVFMLLLFLFHVMIVCAVWECVFCVSYHRHVVPPVLDTQGNWWPGLTLMGVAWASERSNSLRPWRWAILRWHNLVRISWEPNISTWFIWMKYYSCLWNGLKSYFFLRANDLRLLFAVKNGFKKVVYATRAPAHIQRISLMQNLLKSSKKYFWKHTIEFQGWKTGKNFMIITFSKNWILIS